MSSTLTRTLDISKNSDFSSASYGLGSGFIEIELEPDHKKVIIYSQDLGKISKGYMRILFRDMWLHIRTSCERLCRRRKWISTNYYELASLVNMYMQARSTAEYSGDFHLFDLLREKAGRVLRYYKRRVYRTYRKLATPFESPTHMLLGMSRVGTLLYDELKLLNLPFNRHRRITSLLDYLRSTRKNTGPGIT